MKLLFLTYNYPPQKFPRSVQISHLVQELRKTFHVKVITAIPESKGDESLLTFTPLDNVLYAPKSSLTQFIERSRGHRLKEALLPDMFYPWHFDLFKKAREVLKTEKYDVIVTFGQPMSSHIVGTKLKKIFPGIHWIAHFSDPWVDNSFVNYNFWTKAINTYYQNKVFHRADKLVFTSEETIDLVTKKGIPEIRSKCFYLPHSYNPVLYANDHVKNNEFVIRYLGNFYGKRQPDHFFEALKSYRGKDHHLRIELIGAGTRSIEEAIKNAGLESFVFVKKSVDYIESLRLMKTCDLLLIIDAPAEISPFLPSKLIDYIGADRPIFGITPPGTSQKLIHNLGFMVADPLNPDEVLEKFHLMLEKIQSGNLENRKYIKEQFNVSQVAKKFQEILVSVPKPDR